jgi:hypothetical protein
MQTREYNNQDNNATKAYYNARSAQFVKDHLYGNAGTHQSICLLSRKWQSVYIKKLLGVDPPNG